MYQALYRKYRPNSFSKIVGQEHIVDVLKSQIKENKISHAYLFSGVRGTGKTSTAKVFAKAINCENYSDVEGPCGKCSSCVNNSMDTVEIDAASNNSVDNIRQIRDEIVYMPNFGKYKIYIIDEVHMLSMAAFNALLKTLEEPPSHVIFILATTEIQKVPETILSRCQRFEFKKISPEEIYERLIYILEKENISYEKEALENIANQSDGGMRDAISLIDQISAYGDVNVDNLFFILGQASRDELIEFTKNLAQKNSQKALLSLKKMENNSINIKKFPLSVMEILREIMLSFITGEKIEKFEQLYDSLDLDKVTILIISISDLNAKMDYSTHPRILLEAFVVRYCHSLIEGENQDIINLTKRIDALEEKISSGIVTIKDNPKNAESAEEIIKKAKIPPEDVKKIEIGEDEKEKIKMAEKYKSAVIDLLLKNRRADLAALLPDGDVARVVEDEIYISFDDENSSFHKEKLSEKDNNSYIQDLFSKEIGKNVTVHIVYANELSDIDVSQKNKDQSILDKLQETFDVPKEKIIIEE